MFALKVRIQLVLSFKAFLNVAFTGCNRVVHFLESAMHAVNFFFVSMEIGVGWKALDCLATIYNALILHFVALNVLAIYQLDNLDSKFIDIYLDWLILWNCFENDYAV
jgi:hypothetical protein